MAAEERSTLLDALVAAGIDPARMMPGIGCCSITETVELTAHAVKHGCAGVLMLPPFYYKDVSEEGLYRYFSEVVQRVGDTHLKIYLYHIPPVAIVGITPKLVERLLKRLSKRDRRDERQLGRLEQHQNFSRRLCGPSRMVSTCLSAASRSCSPICAMAARAPFPRRPT